MPALGQEMEISGGIKYLEESRDKQVTNQENMHRNQDGYSSGNAVIIPPRDKSEPTVLKDEPEPVTTRHLQSCPLVDIN